MNTVVRSSTTATTDSGCEKLRRGQSICGKRLDVAKQSGNLTHQSTDWSIAPKLGSVARWCHVQRSSGSPGWINSGDRGACRRTDELLVGVDIDIDIQLRVDDTKCVEDRYRTCGTHRSAPKLHGVANPRPRIRHADLAVWVSNPQRRPEHAVLPVPDGLRRRGGCFRNSWRINGRSQLPSGGAGNRP